MKNSTQRFQFRRAAQAAAIMAALASTLLLAGSNSTTLPNGAELTVSITSPVTSTEFEVPPGQPSIDVPIAGTASVGLGDPDATFTYVMDISGSTAGGSGTGCSPILDCEQEFLKQLNQAVIDSGSADEAGLVVFATTAATADVSPAGGDQLLVAPDAPGVAPLHLNTVIDSTFAVPGGNGGVNQFTLKNVGFETNCTAGLQSALTVVQASSNSNNVVVFVGDGLCDNTGGGIAAFNAAIAALAAEGAVVHTVAAGTGTSCTDNEPGFDGGTLQAIADGTGGSCHHVEDPGSLPDIIPLLIGTSLDSLELSIDGNPPTPIPNSDISLPLPQPGAVSVTYTALAAGLAPGDHTLCVRAFGSDVTGGNANVQQCETIHLLQLSATPATATNDLSTDNTHAVTANIAGDAAQVGGREVTFLVSAGPNTGTAGTCAVNADCTTDAAGNVSFTYTVPVAPSSIGTDTITVSTLIGGNTSTVTVEKRWLDLTPPQASCPATVNPAGQNIPKAGVNSPGQNEDGFYQLVATDLVDPNPQIFVRDTGSGMVFGPYPSGTNIKYTEANGATPSATAGSGAIAWHIKGQGDMEVFAVDGSGNTSANAACLVPNPPK